MDKEQNKRLRTVPVNELDLNYMVIKTKWGDDDINPQLREELSKRKYKIIKAGEIYNDGENIKKAEEDLYAMEKRELWSLLEYFSQDLRLGNLSDIKGETKYCEYYLNLAGDLLSEGYKESFIIALSRVASVIELSQSKGGFVRKNLNTFRHKQSITQEDKPKRNLFGMSNKKKNYEED